MVRLPLLERGAFLPSSKWEILKGGWRRRFVYILPIRERSEVLEDADFDALVVRADADRSATFDLSEFVSVFEATGRTIADLPDALGLDDADMATSAPSLFT